MTLRIRGGPYPFPVADGGEVDNTALLCIDLQGDFLLEGGFMDALGLDIAPLRRPLGNVARLQRACRALGMRVLHTREGFPPDLSGMQPNRLWRGADGTHPITGDRGPLGRYLVRGEPGWQIVPEVAPLSGEAVYDKAGYGTFGVTALGEDLRTWGIDNLIVCGVTSDCCVRTTVQEGLDRGFDCLTVADATAAAVVSVHEEWLRQIEFKDGVFGAVADTATVLAGLA